MSDTVLFDTPGPRARSRHRIAAIVGTIVIVGLVVVALLRFKEKGNLDADKWTPFLTGEIWRYYLIPGLTNTLKAAAFSMVLAGLFGIVFGMGRLSHNSVIRWLATIVVEFFRSVPVLVMMFFTFYLLNFTIPGVVPSTERPMVAVIVGLTVYNGAVVAELIRSGVGSLPKGQSEAGLSIGLTGPQTLRAILLPQAITAMLPALVGQLVVVVKDTALGNIILYPELLNMYTQIGSYKSNPVPALIVIAAIFVAINYALTRLAGYIERRLRERGRATIPQGAAGPGHVAAVDDSAAQEALHHADDDALRHAHEGHVHEEGPADAGRSDHGRS